MHITLTEALEGSNESGSRVYCPKKQILEDAVFLHKSPLTARELKLALKRLRRAKKKQGRGIQIRDGALQRLLEGMTRWVDEVDEESSEEESPPPQPPPQAPSATTATTTATKDSQPSAPAPQPLLPTRCKLEQELQELKRFHENTNIISDSEDDKLAELNEPKVGAADEQAVEGKGLQPAIGKEVTDGSDFQAEMREEVKEGVGLLAVRGEESKEGKDVRAAKSEEAKEGNDLQAAESKEGSAEAASVTEDVQPAKRLRRTKEQIEVDKSRKADELQQASQKLESFLNQSGLAVASKMTTGKGKGKGKQQQEQGAASTTNDRLLANEAEPAPPAPAPKAKAAPAPPAPKAEAAPAPPASKAQRNAGSRPAASSSAEASPAATPKGKARAQPPAGDSAVVPPAKKAKGKACGQPPADNLDQAAQDAENPGPDNQSDEVDAAGQQRVGP